MSEDKIQKHTLGGLKNCKDFLFWFEKRFLSLLIYGALCPDYKAKSGLAQCCSYNAINVCSINWRGIMIHVRNIMSTSRDVQFIRGI